MSAVIVGIALLAPAQASQAYDFFVRSAAVDQPRINVAFARMATPEQPLVGQTINPNDPFGPSVPSIQVQAFFDTGASGIVISENIAIELGIALQQHNGQDVVFSDVGPSGVVPFHVSEQLFIRMSPSLGWLDNDPEYFELHSNPANFMTAYQPAMSGPARVQVGPIGSSGPYSSDLNVVGMAAMLGKVALFDLRPTNNFLTLVDDNPNNDDYDAFIRSYVYPADGMYTRGPATLLDPGVPHPHISIALSYADFGQYTTLSPAGAQPPVLTYNPFVGPNPLQPKGDNTPPVTVRHNGIASQGSWLLDTGAAASFISTGKAGELGVSYHPDHPIGSENPRLLGVPLSDQFTLAISGIDGQTVKIAGFYAQKMTIESMHGIAGDHADPRHLNFVGAPMLVFDITLVDPDTGVPFTLDGVLGMNYFTATVDLIQTDFFPIFDNPTLAPFDWMAFDEPAGMLNLNIRGVSMVPEPAGVLGLLGVIPALLVRRRGA